MDTQDRGDQTEEIQTTRRPALARREVLRRAGIGAGVLALGGAATTAPALARGAFAVVKSRPKVVLGWGGATCEAALYLAYHKGFFAAEGLNAELYAESATYDDIQGLSSGTLDGEQNPSIYYFAPLEQGAADPPGRRHTWQLPAPADRRPLRHQDGSRFQGHDHRHDLNRRPGHDLLQAAPGAERRGSRA